MEKLSLIPTTTDLARWLFFAGLILLCWIPSIYMGREQSRPVVVKPEVDRGEIPQIPPEQHPDARRPVAIGKGSGSAICGPKKEILFRSVIHQAADRHQIDPALIKAIIMAESGYNPNAVSKKGAMGLMQLMPGTAEALGVKDSFNPEHNIDAGVEYFKRLMNQFKGNVKLALAAYNAGSRNVRQYQGVPPFKATKYYVKKVLKYYSYYKEQMNGEIDRT